LVTVSTSLDVGGDKGELLKTPELRVTCDSNDEVRRGAPRYEAEEVVPRFLVEVEVDGDAKEQALGQGPVGLNRTGNILDKNDDLVE
jgi:hypothetical protein